MSPRQTATVLPVAHLHDHPANVREHLGDLEDLALSIRENGLIQPVVVTQHPARSGQWMLLAGHRRTAAARLAGLTEVPAVIRHHDVDATDHLTLMLVENVHRRELGPMEKAEAIGALMARGLTQSEVARRIGLHPATVNHYATLLELDDDEREEVRNGNVTARDAREAVRQERITRRKKADQPTIGRPIQIEPQHFTKAHPLATMVKETCTHTTRKKVGGIGCGQCWEDAIRTDAITQARGGAA